jgi:hypothetical protein
MNKTDIISKTLTDMRLILLNPEPPFSEEPDEEEFIISVLQDVLPEGVDIRLCDDFKHLGVECCETCHNFYPHYDMSLIELPGGEKAWVCDSVKWALYPEKYRELQEWSRNSSEGKLLRQMLSGTPPRRDSAECAKS